MLGTTVAPPGRPIAPRGRPIAPHRVPVAPPQRRAAPRVRVEPAPKHRSRRRLRPPLIGIAHAALPKQSWIDRIVRGRAWIPVFGALLVAVVGMRVEILKLSSRVGTQIEQASALQSSNALLRSSVSGLSGTERIETLAEQLGMVMPGPMDIHFVSAANGTHVRAAIRAITAPDPDSFLTGLAAERQADQTSMETAADTSAVGVLADTVPDDGTSVADGIASDPVAGVLSSDSGATTTGSGATTGGAGTATGGSEATAGDSQSNVGSSSSAGDSAAAAAGTGREAATGTASAGTVTPAQSGDQSQPASSDQSATSGLGSGATDAPAAGATDPPTASGTTAAGSQSGSTTGGTSLSG